MKKYKEWQVYTKWRAEAQVEAQVRSTEGFWPVADVQESVQSNKVTKEQTSQTPAASGEKPGGFKPVLMMRWAAGVRGRSSSHQWKPRPVPAEHLSTQKHYRSTKHRKNTTQCPNHHTRLIFRSKTTMYTAEVGLLWISDIYSYDITVASSSSFTPNVDLCLKHVHDIQNNLHKTRTTCDLSSASSWNTLKM